MISVPRIKDAGAIQRTPDRPLPDALKVTGRLFVVAGVACAFGAITQWSILHLPRTLEPLSNTAAPWVLLAFVVALSACRVSESVLLAVVALIAMTLGFYMAQSLRGWSIPHHEVLFWCLGSVVFGPLVGLAAGWLRYSGIAAGALGAGVMGGLIVGEAIHGLTQEKYWTPAIYWHVQLGVGIGLAVVLTLWGARRRPWAGIPALSVSAVACAVFAAATIIAYQVPSPAMVHP